MATQRKSGGAGGRSGGATRGRQKSNAGGEAAPDEAAQAQSTEGSEPDVLLDVPRLAVEEITLEVDNLHARIALEARLADLVYLHVGADVQVERVALEIKGVEAQAQLKARLDKVLAIIERALQTVDKNPELLTELSRSVQGALGDGVGQVGQAAGELVEGTAEDDADDETGGKAARSGSSRGRKSSSRSNGGNSSSGSSRRKAGASRS